jgi:predicted O-methyltransferase YrrM
MNYHQYILDLKSGPVQYELAPGDYGLRKNLKMTNHDFPYSIRPTEFNYLKNIVVDYNLKNGYEIATAFGVSTTALGLGFKQTGGKLVSMDAYVEEGVNSYWTYQNQNPTLYYDTDGYKSAQYLIEHFDLKDNVFLEIGWSPNDTTDRIRKHITEPLDFVFIDCGHFPEQLIKDLESIRLLLAQEYIIVLHDCFPFMLTPEVNQYIEQNFGILPTIVVPEPLGNNMSVIIRK